MSNTLYIREVTLAQISDSTNTVNSIGTAVVNDTKQSRSSAYEPIVVRVSDHPANDVAATDVVEDMALFLSVRHGEPWCMTGHQPEHLIHPLPGVTAAPIADTEAYSIIYPDFDYSTFQ